MEKTTARKPRKPQLNLEVTGRRELSPGMVRVVCRITNHEDYQDIAPPEKYVKLVFFSDATLAETAAGEFPDYWSLRDGAAPEDLPVTRHMTLRRYDAAAGAVWIDVALHGTEGHAGPWAATAKPGDRLVAVGPGGKWVPEPDASWTLLAGDEAAIPAVLANVESLPDTAKGLAILEVQDPAHRHDLSDISVPEGVGIQWVYRSSHRQDERALVSAVSTAPWPEDLSGVQVFVHGEREAMKEVRKELFDRRNLDRSQVSLSGYWAAGRTEDLFQAEKKLPVGKIL
ncbi:siderophore-interacting protein [Kocuria sp. cx-116]|uniref:siderophore-interacting protein n=1 Tax=Kocuria sp. cx-116 TaxID=2771378 RepID=UPI001687003C|nr:siderophore-interacting protein [Kocuria sp. cx-116]MBD2762848.1 siderophore-interacting protein [Kocuria sp. cx-116]